MASRALRSMAVALAALAGVAGGCATAPQVKEVEHLLTTEQKKAEVELSAALAAHRASPNDPATARRLVDAYVEAQHFAKAFELAQQLRESDPESPENLVALGRACFGLGLFDEAAASFNAAYQLRPNDDTAAWWLAYLLNARGDERGARQILGQFIDRGADWRFYGLMLEMTPDFEEQLALIRHYRASHSDDAQVGRLEAAIEQRMKTVSNVRLTSGIDEVVRVPMGDSFRMKLKINGLDTLILFDTTATGLSVSDDLAHRLKLAPNDGVLIQGIADTGFAVAKEVSLGRVQLGNATLEDVPALVIQDLDTNPHSARFGFQGVMGPDILPGYSYIIDRKAEVLEFYPPGLDMPAPAAGAQTQHFYTFGTSMVTEAVVRNRINDKAFRVKMVLDTGTSATLLNREYARQLGFGKFDTTRTTVAKGTTGYTMATEVSFSEVQLAGARFAYDTFWAVGEPTGGKFVPYGYLGRDVLSWFRMKVDNTRRQVTLERYPY